MLLDRICAAIAAAAFALGMVVQLGWLIGNAPAFLKNELTIVFFAAAILPFAYVAAYAGRRDSLPHNEAGELELMPLVRTLPGWARVVSLGLLIYTAVLFAVALVPAIPGIASQACAAAGNDTSACISWDALIAALITAFTAIAFVDAVYLLRTKPRAPDTRA